MAEPKLRFAVVGLGHFAQSAVLPALEHHESVEIGALVSGSPRKLDSLCKRYGVSQCVPYDGLDALLAAGDIDAVYVAVPNDVHAQMTLVAARHGVHVLCEKPMAPTEAECMQMIRACSQRRVKLMVAYRLHFETANLIAVEVARGGEVGQPRVFNSVFTLQVRAGNSRTQPRRGAGPLYDLGVYCVNAARYLFRAEPTEVTALKLHGGDPRFHAIDEAYAVALRFPDERVAQFTCSFGAYARSHYEVIGTDGILTLDNAYEYADDIRMTIEGPHGHKSRVFPKRDQIAAELEYFAKCILANIEPEPSGWEGLADVRILQAVQASARYGRAVPIEPVPRPRRPGLAQELEFPAREPPNLVDVAAGSK